MTYAMSAKTKNTSSIHATLCRVPITVRYTSSVQRSGVSTSGTPSRSRGLMYCSSDQTRTPPEIPTT
jgi:hypothetical protein